MTSIFRGYSDSGWTDITLKVWNDGAWFQIQGLPKFTVKPYNQTVDVPTMTNPPTITTSTINSSNYSTTSPVGASFTRIAPDSPSVRQMGIVPSLSTWPVNNIVNKAMSASMPSPYSVEFEHTGSKLALNLVSASGANRGYAVYVNTERVGPFTAITDSRQVLMDFGTSATRTIRVDLDHVGWAGVDVESTAVVAATPERPSLYILGDSWVEGASWTSAGNDPHQMHMPFLTGRILDASTIIGGYGGTGYVNGSTATTPRHYGATNRVQNIVDANPDVLLVFGTINDGGSTVGTAAHALYADIATKLPNTKIIVVGVQSYGDGTNTGIAPGSVDHQLREAASSSSNVIGFTSPRTEKWVTGTGNTTNPTGDGNADLYHNGENINHLSLAGNRFYAEKLADVVETHTSV